VLGPDRDLGGDDVLAESALQRIQGPEKVGALAIEHVHEQKPGQVELGRALPQPGGVNLDSHHGVDYEDGRLTHAQSAEGVGDKARVSRGIEQVHLALLPFKRRQGQRDRHLAGLLVVVRVGHGCPVEHRAEPVDDACLEQQRLVERRLATTAMADERHVANPIRGLVHAWLLSLNLFGSPPGLTLVHRRASIAA
jgi:hypothetical protein